MLVRGYFVSDRRKQAFVWLAILVVLMLAFAGINVWMSYAGRDFMTAITERNTKGYTGALLVYLIALSAAVPLGVFYRYSEERLALAWREWLTARLERRYFNNRAYYRIRAAGVIDNPDQRISEDTRLFTSTTLSLVLIGANSIITLIAFTGVLWSISGLLVAVLFVYAIAGTFGTVLIGSRLVAINFNQYAKEADFRYGLVRVRDNAESIAFYRGEKRELQDLGQRFAGVVKNTLWLIGWTRNLGFFTSAYSYAAFLVPTLVVAPMFMRGEIQFGSVTQAGGAFATVLAAVSLIVTQFEKISAYGANVERLGALWEGLDDLDVEDERERGEEEISVEERGRNLELKEVTVRPPGSERVLVDHLNLHIGAGQSVLVMGASGTGKSSLLRTIAGLWDSADGEIQRPPLGRIMFLPQRPYMVLGSLRNQLQYPQVQKAIDDDRIHKVLKLVHLEDVTSRVDDNLDTAVDWSNVLSLGEQQRVAFARLLLREPAIAFLDEATSALDEDNEKYLYGLLKKRKIAFLSVGHRSTLRQYHDRLLVLEKDGTWELGDAKEPEKKAKA
jgi:vitamin B12/bleomycin/antimicrobial peptide transport system ATP-binding/permease protein